MPGQHPRCRPVRDDVLLQRTHVRNWAPPGWHWEVLPSRALRLVRNPGPIVDPELLWWRSRGPLSVRREPTPPEVVHRRVREEDKHVSRYMAAMDVWFSNTWQRLWGDDRSYDPVMVPSLWMSTSRASGTASGLDYSVVFDLH